MVNFCRPGRSRLMKLSERFRFQLLKGSLRLGIGTFLNTGLSMLINSSPVVNVLVYSRNCRDDFRVTMPIQNSVIFRDFVTWEQIPDELKIFLIAEEKNLNEAFESIIKRGQRLWIGTIEGRLAIYNWTRNAAQSLDFFFPIAENEVLIWQVETLPAHRGKGLMTLLIDHIVKTLFAEGIHKVYISHATHNLATKRALLKNHFQLIGRGIMRAGSSRGRVWIPSKKAQENQVIA